jgi:endonuclease-8
MPEGDTIHNTARRLRDALAGHQLARFELRRDPGGLRAPTVGTDITDVDAHGKHLLVHFGDGATLHTHMQLTGRWDVYAPGERWRRPAHRARVVMEVDNGTTAVCFDAPVVVLRRAGVMRPATRAERSLSRLGPDLCTDDADLDVVLENLGRLDPATTLDDALLDQRVAGGIGNVFKSEICWAVRVAPTTPLAQLDDGTRRELFETAHRMLRANVGARRRTTYRNGLAVYGHAKRPCPRCRTPIRAARTGAQPRVTYWCPTCQVGRDLGA